MAGPATYDVWLYASRRLRNPNQTGEHEQSLRSLIWIGAAGSEDEAVAKARRALALCLRAIGALTGKTLEAEAMCADWIINECDSGVGDAKVELGEVITEQLAKLRRKQPAIAPGTFQVEQVLRHALRCMLADRDTPPESGTHILSACVGSADEPTEREVETSYAILGPGEDDDLDLKDRPDHVEVLQTLAAAMRLTDPRDDDQDRTEGTVAAPPSATLRAAFHGTLRSTRREDGELPAAFLRAFGCDDEARIFEG